ncbi:MAG: porphobilinogen synthase [Candidatus Thermoplasmatota archaeon]|nr:porphobilinogen synthase [Candidatus Thermoplasmatota archaeon]|tara:strand:+ start:1839 stop:2813 length:975 start_codon:yes stop_codon:yes gene_type:complete
MKKRPRINRWTPARRDLLFSPSLRNSFVQPHFVVSGTGVDNPISSMPGISRQSVDVLCKTIESDMELGIRAHMLFGVVDDEDKDPMATKASDSSMPLQTAVRQLKSKFGSDIVVMTDVCLCTATDHGHCGVIHDHEIDNDSTITELVKIALSHAEAGADYVSASDMMDGRVKAIRKALEIEGFTSTGILSYSVKYASSFYGPFREAASSSPAHGDRRSHQMDIRSGYPEATFEASLDQKEGADIIMVKPALTYLDVVRKVADTISKPVAVYNVSGEYSMVVSSAEDESERKAMVQEIFYSFARAGADVIVSYHCREAMSGKWFD